MESYVGWVKVNDEIPQSAYTQNYNILHCGQIDDIKAISGLLSEQPSSPDVTVWCS